MLHIMKLRRKPIIIAVSILVVLTFAIAYFLFRPHSTSSIVDQITKGMTRLEVDALLGASPSGYLADDSLAQVNICAYQVPEGMVAVGFDTNDRVVSANIYSVSRWDAFWRQVRTVLGL